MTLHDLNGLEFLEISYFAFIYNSRILWLFNITDVPSNWFSERSHEAICLLRICSLNLTILLSYIVHERLDSLPPLLFRVSFLDAMAGR